ncbi:Uncharacterised protein [Capnocytophaga ochracea]|jgi:hypothetical protein|uniref:DUF5958 family protein n=1 Tax=Capnocytophaga ochracea TaxID=1018 RepID=A0A7Z8YBH0_CAPOC|nr:MULTISPECIES: DUF5958 family protein [Capnocytophaga]QLF49565.1 hypothetical protein HW278_01985 [Capnocytophaga sp. oral taxon 902]UZD35978.1 DUF5958 family protein [Capnocytophaga ochracea]UZD40664.1 DUF5958 family protein [Capnocytophaga ochracea]VDG81143.1 Uncharacterised protein [Capnocytophaga ochracea]
MKIEIEILINKYGQGLIPLSVLQEEFDAYSLYQKRSFLQEMSFLIIQSKPKEEDVDLAIKKEKLKSGYTPCVLLKKGISSYNLERVINLPENEMIKTFILFMSIFKIAYSRRFKEEMNNINKWWYWDLSDNGNVERILEGFHNSN